jgi:hypothetical protein
VSPLVTLYCIPATWTTANESGMGNPGFIGVICCEVVDVIDVVGGGVVCEVEEEVVVVELKRGEKEERGVRNGLDRR